MTLKLFQATVMEYKRFAQQLPIAYTEAMSGEVSDSAYVAVHSHVEQGFIIDAPQIVTNVYAITLVKDPRVGEWRVFALGKPVDPIKRQ